MSDTPGLVVISARHEEDLAADRADLFVTVSGSSLFTGRAALTKAKEVSVLVAALERAGIHVDAIGLEGVRAEVQSGILGTSSSAVYQLRIACDDLALLPDVLGAVTSVKNATLNHIEWRYPESAERQARWLTLCVEQANVKARSAAQALGTRLIGVHRLVERGLFDRDEPERSFAPALETGKMRTSARTVDMGFELGHTKRVGLQVTVEYRVDGVRPA